MFKIEREQVDLCREDATREFVERMAAHLRRYFPEQCDAEGGEGEGADGLRAFIRGGIDKAARYGITSQRGASKFLTLMLAFGADFDADITAAPWAAPILRDSSIENQFDRIELLYDAAIKSAESASVGEPESAPEDDPDCLLEDDPESDTQVEP
jgi:hypothetical protein